MKRCWKFFHAREKKYIKTVKNLWTVVPHCHIKSKLKDELGFSSVSLCCAWALWGLTVKFKLRLCEGRYIDMFICCLGSVCIVNNCDSRLENARPGSQFFTIRTSKLVNSTYVQRTTAKKHIETYYSYHWKKKRICWLASGQRPKQLFCQFQLTT